MASAEGAVKTLDAFQFDAQPGLDRECDLKVVDTEEVPTTNLQHIGARRRPLNKLGFALQLCVLRSPGRLLLRASSLSCVRTALPKGWPRGGANSAWHCAPSCRKNFATSRSYRLTCRGIS